MSRDKDPSIESDVTATSEKITNIIRMLLNQCHLQPPNLVEQLVLAQSYMQIVVACTTQLSSTICPPKVKKVIKH